MPLSNKQKQKRKEGSSSSYSSLFKKIKTKNEFQLSHYEKVLTEQIPNHLDNELINLLITKLQFLQANHRLFDFLQANKHFLIIWALGNKNLQLTRYLLENVSGKQRFIMLQYKNHEPIKAFITTCKQVESDSDFKTTMAPIMMLILSVEPNWEIVELFENGIKNQLRELKPDIKNQLNSILESVKKNETDPITTDQSQLLTTAIHGKMEDKTTSQSETYRFELKK